MFSRGTLTVVIIFVAWNTRSKIVILTPTAVQPRVGAGTQRGSTSRTGCRVSGCSRHSHPGGSRSDALRRLDVAGGAGGRCVHELTDRQRRGRGWSI